MLGQLYEEGGLDAELRLDDSPEWDLMRNRAFFEENAEGLGHPGHAYDGSFIGRIARPSGQSPLVRDYLETTFFCS